MVLQLNVGLFTRGILRKGKMEDRLCSVRHVPLKAKLYIWNKFKNAVCTYQNKVQHHTN